MLGPSIGGGADLLFDLAVDAYAVSSSRDGNGGGLTSGLWLWPGASARGAAAASSAGVAVGCASNSSSHFGQRTCWPITSCGNARVCLQPGQIMKNDNRYPRVSDLNFYPTAANR